MQFSEDCATTTLVIQGIEFQVPQPYAAEHVMTGPEAVALNQVFAENMRNNFAPRVKKAIEEAPEKSALNVDLVKLQKDFLGYCKIYEFGVRRTRSTAPSDPVEAEALTLAIGVIKAAARAAGQKALLADKDAINDLAKKLIERDPQYRESAVKRIEAQRAVGAQALEDLMV